MIHSATSPLIALAVALLLASFASTDGRAAVFGGDDRKPYDELPPAQRAVLLNATGGISCFDGTWGTGFIVDITSYVETEPDFYVVATTAGVLYDNETGESRGRCAFLPAGTPGQYLEIGDRLVGAKRVESADSNDWAFARLEKLYEHSTIRIAFGDTYDFGPSYDLNLWAIGFVPDWRDVAVATECQPDDKSRYPSLWKQRFDLAHMIIHNCDFMSASRGGPLIIRNRGDFQAIAVNVGDTERAKRGRLYGVPYDPEHGFHNYSRRFDKGLEQKLIAFVSRFAHVKHPSATMKARRELVRDVQSNLSRLGYDAGPTDGMMGRQTRIAIEAFQATLGITRTGAVSEELLLLLKSK